MPYTWWYKPSDWAEVKWVVDWDGRWDCNDVCTDFSNELSVCDEASMMELDTYSFGQIKLEDKVQCAYYNNNDNEGHGPSILRPVPPRRLRPISPH